MKKLVIPYLTAFVMFYLLGCYVDGTFNIKDQQVTTKSVMAMAIFFTWALIALKNTKQ